MKKPNSQVESPTQPKNEPLLQASIVMLELAAVMALAVVLVSAEVVGPQARPSATIIPLPTGSITPVSTSSPTPLPTATSTFTASPLPTKTASPSTGLPGGELVASQLPAGGEKLIVVSIQQQHVYAYQGDTMVYRFIASTGRHNATVMGTYHILDKLPDPYSDPWGFWMPDWMGIYYAGDVENGFHALPILPNGQRLWANDLGTPVSYGCIVLGVQDAQALYNWADVGTTVQINP